MEKVKDAFLEILGPYLTPRSEKWFPDKGVLVLRFKYTHNAIGEELPTGFIPLIIQPVTGKEINGCHVRINVGNLCAQYGEKQAIAEVKERLPEIIAEAAPALEGVYNITEHDVAVKETTWRDDYPVLAKRFDDKNIRVKDGRIKGQAKSYDMQDALEEVTERFGAVLFAYLNNCSDDEWKKIWGSVVDKNRKSPQRVHQTLEKVRKEMQDRLGVDEFFQRAHDYDQNHRADGSSIEPPRPPRAR